ncbi:MAG: nuclear transport factor 2 family protein [Hyphomicrobiales bacterium]
MKKLIILTVLFLMVDVAIFAQSNNNLQNVNDIKSIITNDYVNGVHNFDDLKSAREYFSDEFVFVSCLNGNTNQLTIDKYFDYYKKAKKYKDKTHPIECKFESIDVEKDFALVKVKLSRNTDDLYTNYISLCKFEDGWKIISILNQRI